ncbi:putative disease resistance protein At3g14460 isoform X2 [Carex rostrata]
MGGIGKTTLAQLAYNDQRIRQRFDKFGWIYVSEDFNVERITKESVESITGNECHLKNLSALQDNIWKEIHGKRVLLVLDDIWNEKKSFWESFQAPFKSAAFLKILVTTRNDSVARIIQTEPTLNLGYLSVEQCWQLFEHYAFGVEHYKDPNKVEIGKQMMNKCGMLPLAVKSIASLLRHEAEEESWREILENELWESDASNEIFPPLQISYARLPTYLKSCFLYCSIFPKDYVLDVGYLVQLWTYQGFIESKENKSVKKIGFEYAQQLCQRSLFEREGRYEGQKIKLHDIVHDLARLNSENGSYSFEACKLPIFPKVMYHLFIGHNVNLIDPIPFDKFIDLRTLIIGFYVKNIFSTFGFSVAPKLRVLEMQESCNCELEFISSVGNLKHLRYLSLSYLFLEMLPECICSLYSLQNLTLRDTNLKELPTKIGNLISLEELIIDDCSDIQVLPESLCQLKAFRKLFIRNCYKIRSLPNNIGNLASLQELIIVNCNLLQLLFGSLCQLKALRKICLSYCELLEELPSDVGNHTNLQTLKITGVCYSPTSLRKCVRIQSLMLRLKCETVGWLKDFSDLGGILCLYGLKNITNIMDVQCSNLVCMRYLEHLKLNWNEATGGIILDEEEFMPVFFDDKDGSVFELTIKSGQNIFLEDQNCFLVMGSLQPHANLKKLEIEGYNAITFPEWIDSLCNLKYLKITLCNNLQFLKAESLPLELEELRISECQQLVSIPGIQKLKSLVKLTIDNCENLSSFMEPSLELTMGAWEGSSGSSLFGLTNLTSLKSLKISTCLKLQVLADELLPAEPCNVEVSDCPGLREWCLQHGINYKDALPIMSYELIYFSDRMTP